MVLGTIEGSLAFSQKLISTVLYLTNWWITRINRCIYRTAFIGVPRDTRQLPEFSAKRSNRSYTPPLKNNGHLNCREFAWVQMVDNYKQLYDMRFNNWLPCPSRSIRLGDLVHSVLF